MLALERLRQRAGPERERRGARGNELLSKALPTQERSLETRRRLLDAAVDELIEGGYARFTTLGVAKRSKVSRGAQQHHFPHRTELVAAAIRHLGERNLAELRELTGGAARGSASLPRILDAIFAQYSGPFFVVMLELSLAARSDAQLRRAIAREEKALSAAIDEWAGDALVAGEGRADQELVAITLSTIRGIAALKLLGHPESSVERQWRSARRRLIELLSF